MKLYISLDMEGIPGTFNWDHEKKNPLAVKKSIHDHLKDLIDAISNSRKNEQITQIVIADSHSAGDNVDYDFCRMDERIELISGGPRPQYMMPLFSSEYDYVFFVGYHAGTGALRANMDHSYSNSKIQRIWINDMPMNEALINAAFAGYHKVPVALVTGDLALKHELLAPNAMPWIQYVTTKEAVAKFAAKNYNPLKLRAELFHAVNNVFSNQVPSPSLFVFESPIRLKIEFHSTSMADMACMMPYTKRLDGKSVEYVDDDYAVVFEAIVALITLAYGAGF